MTITKGMVASKSAVNDSVFDHSAEVNVDVDEGIEEEFEGKSVIVFVQDSGLSKEHTIRDRNVNISNYYPLSLACW